jgi:hypothetical protein
MPCGIQTPSTPKLSVPSSESLRIVDDGDGDDGYNFPAMFKAKEIILICTPCCLDIENSV